MFEQPDLIMICRNYYVSKVFSRDVVSCQYTDVSFLLAVPFDFVVCFLCC